MNTLEQKHLILIGSNCEHDSYCTDKECQLNEKIVCVEDQRNAKECATITIEFAKGFAEWLNENRWYTYTHDKEVWYYSFEHGTSMSDAEYLKNYTKTTDELISAYLKTLS